MKMEGTEVINGYTVQWHTTGKLYCLYSKSYQSWSVRVLSPEGLVVAHIKLSGGKVFGKVSAQGWDAGLFFNAAPLGSEVYGKAKAFKRVRDLFGVNLAHLDLTGKGEK